MRKAVPLPLYTQSDRLLGQSSAVQGHFLWWYVRERLMICTRQMGVAQQRHAIPAHSTSARLRALYLQYNHKLPVSEDASYLSRGECSVPVYYVI